MVEKPPRREDDDLEFLEDNSIDEEFIEVDNDLSSGEDKTVPRAKIPQPVRPIEPVKEAPPPVPPPLPKTVHPPRSPQPEPIPPPTEPAKLNPREMLISSPASDTLISTISEGLSGFKLVFFDGPNIGEEYSLDKSIITLGRGADNDIVIKDVSVSRRHAEIRRDLGQMVIRDLGSGNGVVLNDERISEHNLCSGDVIKLGNTRIRFVQVYDIYATDQEQAWIGEKVVRPSLLASEASVQTSPAARVPPPKAAVAAKETGRRSPLLFYAIGLFLLFVVLLVFVKFIILAPDKTASEKGASVAGESKSVSGDKALEAQRLIEEGIERYKNRDFKKAHEKFIAAISIDPSNKRAQRYKDRSAEELINKNYLDSAQEFMDKEMPKGAIEVAKKISAESAFYDDAQSIIKSATAKYILQLRETAQRYIDEKDYHNAMESVNEILSLDGSDQKAQEMKAKIEERISSQKKVRGGSAQRTIVASMSKSTKGAGEEESVPGKVISAPGPVAARAVQMFKNKDVNGAVQTLESSSAASNPRVQRLLQSLKAFAQIYPQGSSAYKAKKETAISSLERAYSIARSIAPGRDNQYIEEISRMLSDMYAYKGIRAFYKEDYFSAIDNLQKALKLNPNHEAAKKKMGEMGNVAQRLFEEAYVLKNADPEAAKKKFKIILRIAPPNSEFYKKAKEWLNRL